MSGTGPILFHDLDGLLEAPPCGLGSTGWVEVDATAVRRFGDATGAGGRAGEVPPLMLVSLTNRFLPELMQVPGASSGVNYGTDSVRFGPAAQAGDRIRARATLLAATPVGDAVQTTVEIRIEGEGAEQPLCVVRSLSRWMK